MNPRCQNCKKEVVLEAGVTEFTVKEEYRKERALISEKVYLCEECGAIPPLVELLTQLPWYAGHKII